MNAASVNRRSATGRCAFGAIVALCAGAAPGHAQVLRIPSVTSQMLPADAPTYEGRRTLFLQVSCSGGESWVIDAVSDWDNTLTILDGSGNRLAFNDDANGTRNAHLDWTCPATAWYRLGVGAYAAGSGHVSLSVQRGSGSTAQPSVLGYISLGATVGGNIDGGTPQYQGRRTAFYNFTCGAGQSVQANVNSAYDNVAFITDMSGNQLAYNDDANGSLNAQINWTCPAGGTYRVGAGALGSQTSGPFTLSLQGGSVAAARPLVAGYISVGATVGGSLDMGSPEYNGRRTSFYNFQCSQGQSLRVNVTAAFDNVAFVADGSGNQLAYNDDANGSLNAQIDWVCPSSGTYRAGAGALGAGTGPFTLSLQSNGMVSVGPSVAGYIRIGATVGGTIDLGTQMYQDRPTVFYNFTCAAGQSLRVNVYSSFDNVAFITDVNGNQLAYNDDANGSLNAQINWTCPAGGTYRAGAGSLRPGVNGSFTLSLAN